MPLCVQLACAHLLNSSFSDVSGPSEIPHEAVIATGEVCSPKDTCAYNGRCLSRCCQPNIAMPDNVAECNDEGWMESCKSGYEWVGGIGCANVTVIATGEVCSPEDTCAYNGRCLSRCCQPNVAKPDNVAECNQDGWMASCKSGYERVPGIGCDMVPGKVHLP